MRDRVSTASFTARQQKSSELGWEEIKTLGSRTDMQNAHVSVERGMLTEQLSS